MKKITVLLVIGVAMAFGCGNPPTNNQAGEAKPNSSFKSIDTTKLAAGTAYYQCPMHPEVISDKPGNCPICGDMAMEKIVKQ